MTLIPLGQPRVKFVPRLRTRTFSKRAIPGKHNPPLTSVIRAGTRPSPDHVSFA